MLIMYHKTTQQLKLKTKMTKVQIIVNNELHQEYNDDNFNNIFSICDIKKNIADYFYDQEEFYGDGKVIVKADNLEFDISDDVADIVSEYLEESRDEAQSQKDIEESYYRGLI